MLFGDGTGQAALDEIIGAYYVPGQRPRIAAQPWNFCFEQPSEFVHRFPHPSFRALAGSTIDLRMRERRNPLMYPRSRHGEEL